MKANYWATKLKEATATSEHMKKVDPILSAQSMAVVEKNMKPIFDRLKSR